MTQNSVDIDTENSFGLKGKLKLLYNVQYMMWYFYDVF